MKLARHLPDAAGSRRAAAPVAAIVALLSLGLLVPLGWAHAAATVPTATATSFAILGGSAITNTGPSVVEGDIGLHPGTAVSGYAAGADSITHVGSLHVADGVALQAKNDLGTAYTDAADRPSATEVPTELGGTILTPGVYSSASGTFGVTGALTLDAGGDPGAVFIFQTSTTLITASASSIVLQGGADACNVFWQVGSSATLGTDSTFRGTILAEQSITLARGASVEGRVLAREAAVTMDTNVITLATCSDDDGTDDDGTDDDGTDDDGTDDGTDDDGTDDDGTDDGTDDDGTVDDGTDDGTDDGADDGTDDGADDGTDDGADDGSTDGTTPPPSTPAPSTPALRTPAPSTPGTPAPGPSTPGTSTPGTPTAGSPTPRTPDRDTEHGTPTNQVREVPSGPVAAGAGPGSSPDGGQPVVTASWLLVAALALTARRDGPPHLERA